jgi:fatty acid desaturase
MRVEFVPAASLVPHSTYVRELRSALPAEAFEPATSRLALVPVHLVVIATSTVAISSGWLPRLLAPLLSLVIGVSFAGLTFVGHEAVHGGIVRHRKARRVVGWIAFLPFTLSPRLWAAWHDRVHHANANLANDPDMYPTLADYRASRLVRFLVDAFALGGRRWRGALSLVFGFTVQSVHQLVSARRCGLLKARDLQVAIAETLAGLVVWASVAVLVGFVSFLFVFVVPLLVANAIVMSFILTNHSLSPRVEINDPLVSGLSVTAPRWVEWITLQFGYHVEHHLFPSMSSRNARKVRDLLRQRWPERYRSMPLRTALGELYRTARVYKDAVTLIDPRTGREYATLLPDQESPDRVTDELAEHANGAAYPRNYLTH